MSVYRIERPGQSAVMVRIGSASTPEHGIKLGAGERFDLKIDASGAAVPAVVTGSASGGLALGSWRVSTPAGDVLVTVSSALGPHVRPTIASVAVGQVFTLSVDGAGASAAAVTALAATGQIRNVAIGSALPNQVVTIGSSKARFKERVPITIAADCDVLYVPWANTYISNTTPFEVAGPGDLTVEKVAIEVFGRVMPITYGGGNRGATIIASTNSQVLGDGNSVAAGLGVPYYKIPKGTVVYLRFLGTMPAGGGVAATAFGTEQQYRFATGTPADDDIDGTGPLAAPAAPDAVNVPGPVGIFGRVYALPGGGFPVSLGVLGDSITDNTNDFPGAGTDGLTLASVTGGGGWPSRLAAAAVIPLLKMTLGGHKADNYFSQHAWRDSWWPYVTLGICELGINDSLTAANVLTRLRTAWTAMWTGGVQRVMQATISPKSVNDSAASPWNVNTTLAGEVVSVGTLDYAALNTLIKADVGNASYHLQEVLDVEQLMGDASNKRLFPVPPSQLNTTLAAAISAGSASSVSLNAAASRGQLLAIGAGAAGVQTVKVSGPSTGSGPYATPIVTQTLVAAASGTAVAETYSADGTHEGPKAHVLIASGLLAQAQGWAAAA